MVDMDYLDSCTFMGAILFVRKVTSCAIFLTCSENLKILNQFWKKTTPAISDFEFCVRFEKTLLQANL